MEAHKYSCINKSIYVARLEYVSAIGDYIYLDSPVRNVSLNNCGIMISQWIDTEDYNAS